MKYKKILIGLTTAVSTAVLAEWFTSNNVLTVSRIAVHNKKIPQSFDGFRIVQISDRHCSDFGKDNERLIRKIKYQYPDIVVMTGDMVDSQNSKIGSFYKLVEKLAQKYPIYYVVGNHELNLGKGKLSRMIAKLKGLGVIVLDNSNESIRRNGDELVVYFPLYEIAPYVAGIQSFDFSSENLAGLLKPEIIEAMNGQEEQTILFLDN